MRGCAWAAPLGQFVTGSTGPMRENDWLLSRIRPAAQRDPRALLKMPGQR